MADIDPITSFSTLTAPTSISSSLVHTTYFEVSSAIPATTVMDPDPQIVTSWPETTDLFTATHTDKTHSYDLIPPSVVLLPSNSAAEEDSGQPIIGFFSQPRLVVGTFGSITIFLVSLAVFITILVMRRKRRLSDDARAEDKEKLAPNGPLNNRRYSTASSTDGSAFNSPLHGGSNGAVLVQYPDSAYAPSTYSSETLRSDGRTPSRSSTYAQQLQRQRGSPVLGQVDEERVSLKTASTVTDSIYAPAPPYIVDEDPFRRESCASS